MIARWNPSSELAGLHTAMDRLFSEFFGGPSPGGTVGGPDGMPTQFLPLDLIEDEHGYEIIAPVPGAKPEQVEVTFSEGVLTVHARTGVEQESQGRNYIRRERAHGNLYRQIALPGNIDESGIAASFEDGLLKVRIPKVPRPQPTRIAVSKAAGKAGAPASGQG